MATSLKILEDHHSSQISFLFIIYELALLLENDCNFLLPSSLFVSSDQTFTYTSCQQRLDVPVYPDI